MEQIRAVTADGNSLRGGFGNRVVVENLPEVGNDKSKLLEQIMRKIYARFGEIKEGGLLMPADPDSQRTLGYCFIEFNNAQEAELAKERTHGYRLDRSHVFAVNICDDIEKFMSSSRI